MIFSIDYLFSLISAQILITYFLLLTLISFLSILEAQMIDFRSFLFSNICI